MRNVDIVVKQKYAEMLAENIRRFIKNPNKDVMGENARLYYEKHFEQEKFMDRLEKNLYIEGVK